AGVREACGDHDFYDFEAKYLDLADAKLTCPADVDDATTARIRELSAAVFRLFDCTGLARVDTFVTDSGEVLINEINTLPGFTPTSAYPF
ncbi:ATP-grasp domain-containing protein, partial [Mycobacterium tuberculosis]|nr:ATP-grasp domain-containing protein [Mycobacterium tuberculosis]